MKHRINIKLGWSNLIIAILKKELFMKNSIEFQDIKELFKETDRKFQETDRKFQETDRKMKETDKQIKNLGKHIGGLGKKFGLYTEALAIPSVKKILMKKFNVDVVLERMHVRQKNDEMEIDVFGYVNRNINKAYFVEIKSKLNSNEIKSTLKNLKRFFKFFPDHKNKKLYGIVAAVDFTSKMKQKVLEEGLYFAQIHDDIFRLDTPVDFIPKIFKHNY